MSRTYPGLNISPGQIPPFRIDLQGIFHIGERRLWGVEAAAIGMGGEEADAIAAALPRLFLPSLYQKIALQGIRSATTEYLPESDFAVLLHMPSQFDPGSFDWAYAERAAADAGLHPARLYLQLSSTSVVSLDEIVRFAQQSDAASARSVPSEIVPLQSHGVGLPRVAKLDASVAASVEQQPDKHHLIAKFVEASIAAGISLLAEGVATPEQCRQFMRAGVVMMKGPLFLNGIPDTIGSDAHAHVPTSPTPQLIGR